MNIIKIVFSPTGGTQRVADAVAQQWGGESVTLDLSQPGADFSGCGITKDDLVLIAMPSFGGRAPAVAIQRLKQVSGGGARCVLVCVYGNRAYEDTLAEMEDAAKACGFRVIAAIAAVAEHSILPQYAAGRPDASDLAQLAEFAAQIRDRETEVASIPGQRPYKKAGAGGLVPKPGKDCVSCGRCASQCPVAAIDPKTFAADGKTCISCMRCVRLCPQGTRTVNSVMVSAVALALKKACSVRKENELFV